MTEPAAAETPAPAPPSPEKPAPTGLAKYRRPILEALVIVLVFLGIRAWNSRALAERPPDTAWTTMAGDRFTPAAPGEPTVVHFFATWCGVCQAEEGNVAALARDHRVVLVASQSGDAAQVETYLAEHGLEGIPVVLDASGDVAESWGISAFPSTFYLDPSGGITFAEVGYTTEIGMRARATWAR